MADDDVVIRASNLGKSYTRYKSRTAMLLDRLQGTTKRGEAHWALRGVSFEVKRGEFFGVIGRNGAGKSTLLQLLAGVMQPTEGTLEVKGKVLALLELGASFDPLSTGRENCRVQMALFGVPAGELEAKMKAVEEFAEIGPAFEEPVKTYSSGMFVRVAFAVNTVLRPDILLVDEALVVGDVFFQRKCFDVLERLRTQGTAVVLVSHSLIEIVQHCSRACALRKGKVVDLGDSHTVAHRFFLGGPAIVPETSEGLSLVNRGVRIVLATVGDQRGRTDCTIVQGQDLRLDIDFEIESALYDVTVGFMLHHATGMILHGRSAVDLGLPPLECPKPGERWRAHFALNADLAPGEYLVHFGVAGSQRPGAPPVPVGLTRKLGPVRILQSEAGARRFSGVVYLPVEATLTCQEKSTGNRSFVEDA